tara:strand:+ start:7270 stop:7668 length:399 start_codon:yes stop_codon:yes gene_type:complete
MNDIADLYGGITKKNLIKGLKKYLRENNIRRKRSDGYGKMAGNGLERPEIEGVVYSWNEFERLPKDVVVVYSFMKGCDIKYLIDLKEKGWFNRNKNYRNEKIAEGWQCIYKKGRYEVMSPTAKRPVNEFRRE